MNTAPSLYPIALGISAGGNNSFPVPLNVQLVGKNQSDRVEVMTPKMPFAPIEPVPVLKSDNYSLGK
jgi:hypothetical protein